MTPVSSTEARQNLPALLKRAGYGKERICIESHGKPIAVLISYEDLQRLEAIEDAIDSAVLRKAMTENDGFTTLDAVVAVRNDLE